MMMTALAVTAALAGFGAWRQLARTTATTAPSMRPRNVSPAASRTASAAAAPRKNLVRLHSAGGCACGARELLGNRPIDAAKAPLLTTAGCGHPDCTCRYERYVDRRRGARRIALDRRDDIRFENGRRLRTDRRAENSVWVGRA